MIGAIAFAVVVILLLTLLIVFAIGSGPTRAQLDRPKRMEAGLRIIQQWKCLNPPGETELCDDELVWLKAVVDDALKED